jgi:undecaprenyl-diphosphatase
MKVWTYGRVQWVWKDVLRRVEPAVLIAAMLIVGSIWGVIELADEFQEGETHQFDTMILMAMRNPNDIADPLGPPWFAEMARDMTALGGLAVLSMMTTAVVGYLLLTRKPRSAVLILVAVIGGLLISVSLKAVFDRPRPELFPHGSYVDDPSFPSGHSMLSAVMYLTLGTLLAKLEPHRRTKAYILGWAIVLAVLVGLSRIYLGVHWPTDVLGGWAAGLAWALLCWIGARWLQSRGQVEKPDLEEDD